MQIPLVYEHLFYKYFVRRSVGQFTKGKRASLLMDVVILVFLIFFSLEIVLCCAQFVVTRLPVNIMASGELAINTCS